MGVEPTVMPVAGNPTMGEVSKMQDDGEAVQVEIPVGHVEDVHFEDSTMEESPEVHEDIPLTDLSTPQPPMATQNDFNFFLADDKEYFKGCMHLESHGVTLNFLCWMLDEEAFNRLDMLS